MKRRKKRRGRISPEEKMLKRVHIRAILMGLFFTLCIGFLLREIRYYQREWGDEYSRLSVMQSARHHIGVNQREVTPIRGMIMDRNMQPIASTQQVFTVFLDVYALHNRHLRDSRPEDNVNIRDQVLAEITQAFGVHYRYLIPLFETQLGSDDLVRNRRHHIVGRDIMPEVAIEITDRIPELHRTEGSLRWHNDPMFAPQVLGFNWGDSTWGLELQYMRELQGEFGRTIWMQGGDVEEIPVRHGYTLITTIDSEIQRAAQRHVDQTFLDVPSEHVGIIVMDPFTGAILAMAQAPSFSLADPMNTEFFTDPNLVESWDSLSNQERSDAVMRLWRNYHITNSGEPGSTFKPFVVAAAIEEGVINEHSRFYCEGRRTIIDRELSCWETSGHGSLSLREAIYLSCNLAMVDINRTLGRDHFYRYRGYFGFGMYTGIDFPGEFDVSSPLVMYPFSRLNPVEMGTSSMGQGFNTTTLQMITGYAALINGGNYRQPFFVQQVVDVNGNVVHEHDTEAVVRRVVSQSTSDFVRRELEFGVTAPTGTGRALAIPGHSIGGKTGTGQQGVRADGRVSASQVAFTPVENPEFLVIMMIDHLEEIGGHVNAGRFVAPRLREFLLELISIRNLQPSEGVMTFDQALLAAGHPVMPDFTGRRLADVTQEINVRGSGGYFVVGSGTIIERQFPLAGQASPTTGPITFWMDEDTRVPELMVLVPDVEGMFSFEAELLLRELGLPSVSFESANENRGESDGMNATTAQAPPPVPGEESTFPVEPIRAVYRQFPAAGSRIERGTQVMLRVR